MSIQTIKTLENREERTQHKGNFSDFHSLGEFMHEKRYSLPETESYSEYQNFLYKRAMFGLKMYTPEEIKAMHWQKRQRIQKVHQRTQKELNLWKQSQIIAMTNKIFGLFRGPIAKYIMDATMVPDGEFLCQTSFKELGITKEDIIDKLLDTGLLPYNFRTIK